MPVATTLIPELTGNKNNSKTSTSTTMASSNPDNAAPRMRHRFLGKSGLLVSELGLGSWMFPDEKSTPERWYEMMKFAFEHGINFFDSAETYGNGQADVNMGAAIKLGLNDGVWSREDLVVTAKVFAGTKGWFEGGPNDQGVSRKHIVEGVKASLARMQLDYVDVVFCHRHEPYTPIEETVRAMNFVIEQGWAFYWGTSTWSAADILEACNIADRLGLIRPIVEQPEYSLLQTRKVEVEYQILYEKYGLGLTTWSPLAFGVLTGKYSSGTAEGTRMDTMKQVFDDFEERVAKADKLKPIAEKLDCSMAQLAIAWCLSNGKVSAVLVGASSVSQLEQNLKAMSVVNKLTPEVKQQIEDLSLEVNTPAEDFLTTVRGRHL